MRAGRLNNRIEFYHYTSSQDGYGGQQPVTHVTDLTTNANVKPLNQDRTIQANQQVLVGGYQISIRYRQDFTPLKTMFIKYKNIDLTISSISQSEEDREMWFIIAMVKK